MKKLKEALESGDFAITAECGPPKGTNITETMEHAKHLLGKINAINVTDNQSAVVRIGSLPISRLLYEMGHDPIYQLTCRDRNRLAIQSDLMGAHVLGIKNVLCMTGDHVSAGDHKTAKAVYDLESVQLLQTVAALNGGHDLAGNEMLGATDLYQGAVVTPEANPLEPQMLKFEKKIRAGANFFQTQAIYDMDNFRRFMDRARKYNVKVLAGILLLKNAGMANFLNKFVPGITVPQDLIDRLKAAGKEGALECGMDIAAEQVRIIKEQGIADGAHVMAIGLENKVPDILQRAGIA